jgi:hypothetical protein
LSIAGETDEQNGHHQNGNTYINGSELPAFVQSFNALEGINVQCDIKQDENYKSDHSYSFRLHRKNNPSSQASP